MSEAATDGEADIVGTQQTLIAAGALLERRVDGHGGKRIGKVVEVMLVAGKGEIAYVVVAAGGLLGFGERLHAVEWRDFRIDPWNGTLSLERAGFDGPGFDKDRWPVQADA